MTTPLFHFSSSVYRCRFTARRQLRPIFPNERFQFCCNFIFAELLVHLQNGLHWPVVPTIFTHKMRWVYLENTTNLIFVNSRQLWIFENSMKNENKSMKIKIFMTQDTWGRDGMGFHFSSSVYRCRFTARRQLRPIFPNERFQFCCNFIFAELLVHLQNGLHWPVVPTIFTHKMRWVYLENTTNLSCVEPNGNCKMRSH